MPQHQIEITERQTQQLVEIPLLESVIRRVLLEEHVKSATISLALVSDAEIHEINRRFLGHDYPTDVISFRLDDEENPATESTLAGVDSTEIESINGELIVSTETAIREAKAHGWSPQAELVLYVVHGMLHLCGYDDLTDEARPVMRARERELLSIWGFKPTGLEA